MRSPGFLYERYRSGRLCDSDRYAQRAGVEQSVHDTDTYMSSVEEEAVFIEIRCDVALGWPTMVRPLDLGLEVGDLGVQDRGEVLVLAEACRDGPDMGVAHL